MITPIHCPLFDIHQSSVHTFEQLETLRPIFFKLHVGPSFKGGLKICTNGYGPLSKMAAMPIYGKNSFLQNQECFETEF